MDIYKQKTENVMPHLSVISINGYVVILIYGYVGYNVWLCGR